MIDLNEKIYDLKFSKSWLAPKYWVYWLGGLLLMIFAFVPVRLRDALGRKLADWMFDKKLLKNRRRIADINLQLCFPDWDEAKRRDTMLQNVRIFMQLILGIGELIFRSKHYLAKRVDVEGFEYVHELEAKGETFVALFPHTYPLDYAGLTLTSNGVKMCAMFKQTGNPIFDWVMTKQRNKYGGLLFERKAGLKTLIEALKQGYSTLYLADEDFGPERSVMVPFFAANKATLPALSPLIEKSGARVLPIYTGYDQKNHKVKVYIHPPMVDYPSGDLVKDAKAMNHEIEKLVLRSPEQYMWSLKLLKTVEGSDQRRY